MTEPVIRTEKLTRTYNMGASIITALREADLTVQTGEFIALMGASGSGKSTLLNLVGLLDRASSGEYFLEENRSHPCDAMNWLTCAAGELVSFFRISTCCPGYLPGKTWRCLWRIAGESLGSRISSIVRVRRCRASSWSSAPNTIPWNYQAVNVSGSRSPGR